MVRSALAIVAVLSCLGSGAQADTVYKYRDGDGRIVYADRPIAAGPALTELHAPRDTPGELWTHWALREIAAYERAAHLDLLVRERVASRAGERVRAAEQAYEVERERLSSGAAPLPGERIGNAGGGSRLRPKYFARQAELERSVFEAQRNYLKAIGE